MAQVDVFKRERALAKKAQQATANQPPPPQPVQQAPDSSEPSFFGNATSYLADILKPQQGTIDTRPPQAGVPLKKKNPNISSLRFKSPIYG